MTLNHTFFSSYPKLQNVTSDAVAHLVIIFNWHTRDFSHPKCTSYYSISIKFPMLCDKSLKLKHFLPARQRELRGNFVCWCLAVLALLTGVSACERSCRGPNLDWRPNLVLIILDTVRADVLGVVTEQGPLTPNIDEISRQGTTFVNAFAPAP